MHTHAHEWLYFAQPAREGTQISENYVNPPQIQRVLLKPALCKTPYPFSLKETRGPMDSPVLKSCGPEIQLVPPSGEAGVGGRADQVESGGKEG